MIGQALSVLRTMTQSYAELKAAQARWALNLTVLQEEEQRLFSMLEEESRKTDPVPQADTLDRLKAARHQCNEAFKMLVDAIEDRITQITVSQDASDRHGDAPRRE